MTKGYMPNDISIISSKLLIRKLKKAGFNGSVNDYWAIRNASKRLLGIELISYDYTDDSFEAIQCK